MATWHKGGSIKEEGIINHWRSPDPVFQYTDGWYFWNEIWVDCLGPFGSEEECRTELDKFVKWLLGPPKLILYRIQHKATGAGPWYTVDAEPTDTVHKLTSSRLADMPMGYDPRYKQDGKNWRCAAWDIDHFSQWFTLQDLEELVALGFEVIQFASDDYIKEENQVLFTPESMRNVIVITDILREKLQ